MLIDIRNDIPEIKDYVRRRIAAYVATASKADLVSRIDLGFEFGQGNWIALFIDTRPDAEPDGTWTKALSKMAEQKTLLERPGWPIWGRLPKGERVFFIDLSGNNVDVMDNPDELISGIVGDALKHVLLSTRAEGLFGALSKTPKCELAVENLDGYYGWPQYKDRGRENLA